MTEATGLEARTIHRLLEFDPAGGGFKRTEEHQLDCNLLVLDEISMVDVPIMAATLKAVRNGSAVILVGDPGWSTESHRDCCPLGRGWAAVVEAPGTAGKCRRKSSGTPHMIPAGVQWRISPVHRSRPAQYGQRGQVGPS
jgi:hypothetical protein